MRLPMMPQPHTHPRGRQYAVPGLGPLDEDHGVLEVGLEVAPLRVRDAVEAVEIQVRDVRRARVTVPEGVRRAGHRPRDAELAGRTAHEGGLPGAELSRDRDNVAGLELPGDRSADALGLLGRGRLELDHRPSLASWPRRGRAAR